MDPLKRKFFRKQRFSSSMLVFDVFRSVLLESSWIFKDQDVQQWSSCWTCLPNSLIEGEGISLKTPEALETDSWLLWLFTKPKADVTFQLITSSFAPPQTNHIVPDAPLNIQVDSGQPIYQHWQTCVTFAQCNTLRPKSCCANVSAIWAPQTLLIWRPVHDIAPPLAASSHEIWDSRVINEGHKWWWFHAIFWSTQAAGSFLKILHTDGARL